MNKLSRTAKRLDTVLRVLFWIMIVCGIVAAIAALAPLILRKPAPDSTSLSLDLDFIKFHLARPDQEAAMAQQKATMAAMVMLIAGTGTGAYCIHLVRNILKPMKEGQPFRDTVSINIKKLAWVALIGGFIINCLELVSMLLIVQGFNLTELFTSDKITDITFNYTFDVTFILIAAGLFLLSYIFRYGAQLQQLSDETL